MSAKRVSKVLKFGSSVIPERGALQEVVQEIYQEVRRGEGVVAVVSAVGDTTEALLSVARSFAEEPEPTALAALLQTGELTTVSLLSVLLSRAGIPNRFFDPGEIRLQTQGDTLDGTPVSVDTQVFEDAIQDVPVVIVPGFVGRCEAGRPSLLGRGGSDLTALFLAQQLGASCILYKDFDGIYECDPAASDIQPRRYSRLRWEDALELDCGVVQSKGIDFAKRHELAFEVTSIGSRYKTQVGPCSSRLEAPASSGRPLRIALFGLGTVGLGVYQQLCAQPERYEVVGIAVRDATKHQGKAPAALLTEDPEELFSRGADLVIEVMGGVDLALKVITRALASGVHVVTANKDAIACHGRWLRQLSQAHGAKLLYSASVGGAVPTLEAIAQVRAGGILELEGVLNGTTNFILDRLAQGHEFDAAVKEAQRCGFAEADPSFDLNGLDAAHKLSILILHAFGVEIAPRDLPRSGIEAIDRAAVEQALAEGKTYRLLGRCRREGEQLKASIEPVLLPLSHPLAQTRDEHNRLQLRCADGELLSVSGKGAGRWPTAAAVFADVQDAFRSVEHARQLSPAASVA